MNAQGRGGPIPTLARPTYIPSILTSADITPAPSTTDTPLDTPTSTRPATPFEDPFDPDLGAYARAATRALARRAAANAAAASTATTPAPAPTAGLATLPPEILDLILAHVPPAHRQRTALSLARVLPHSAVNPAHVWTHLVVRDGRKFMPLWRRLMAEDRRRNGGTRYVRTFSQESWRGDVDILNNVLRCLPSLNTLMLNVGTNFAPEHLQEMFEEPRDGLERMEIRFRPYVEQATYYQFLKGSYFDTAIETLYRSWPETPAFTQLSIVQDLPPRNTAPPTRAQSAAHSERSSLANSISDLRITNVASGEGSAAASASTSDTEGGGVSDDSTPPTSIDEEPIEPYLPKGYTGHGPIPYLSERLMGVKPKTFAQPIVFFDIKCLARFAASPVAKHLTHLRLRVPQREIAYVLVSAPPGTLLFPSLKYLDLSTTNLRLDAVLATLLRTYGRLEHLVLDRVNLFGFAARERGTELCKELGAMIVSAGLARGKERERQISVWDTVQRTRVAESDAARRRAQAAERSDSDEDEDTRAVRDALRAEEAMREEMQRQIALARSRRGHRSAGHSTFMLRDRPRRGRANSSTSTVATADLPPQERLYFVLPPLPSLKSISIGGEAPLLNRFNPREWEDEFHAGWRDGLAKLHGWAVNVADKYERALRKAEEWREWQSRHGTNGAAPKGGKGAKGKAPASKPRVPLDVRLYRFATSDEPLPEFDPNDPTVGLVEVEPVTPRDYLLAYKDAIADAELYTHSHAVAPPCVLCTVPDCEGPLRRGAEGERQDGRGGMDKMHRPGCGHLAGRRVWGWDGVV